MDGQLQLCEYEWSDPYDNETLVCVGVAQTTKRVNGYTEYRCWEHAEEKW